jgi:hypothetical protein
MKKKFWLVIIIIVSLLLLLYSTNAIITQTEKYNCNIHNCPIITNNNDKLYKIYNEYNDVRKKNVILQKSNIHIYFLKQKVHLIFL